MNLRSDNEAPAAPELIQAVVEANQGPTHAYGMDPWTEQLEPRFSELFETDLRVFPISTGTAANAASLSQVCPPYGAVFCHEEAHIEVDECGAFETWSGGAKLLTLSGEHGRIPVESLQAALDACRARGSHGPVPSALSITQATECGTVYSRDEVTALCEYAHAEGLVTHMDGARFANAAAAAGESPADLTWRAGIDVLSFAASKNGGLIGEAVIFFKPELAEAFAHRRMKGGHVLSKMRFVSAQLLRYIEDGLWLQLATRANEGARRIGTALDRHPNARLIHPVEANEVFVMLDGELDHRLTEAGIHYRPWPGHPDLKRMVSPYDISDDDLERFESLLAD